MRLGSARPRWKLIAAFLAIGAGYIAYPYFTLYRLGSAIRQGDATTLQALVNWPSVREGIKEDICDLVMDEPQAAVSKGKLPPFGASFVRGIASNAVDQAVTPEALLAAVRAPEPRPAPVQGADVKVLWAFFDAPDAFSVSLAAAGQNEPIRLQLVLHHGTWRVNRVWLPADLLGQTNPRT